MTKYPAWLVERAALDEVPPASRDRITDPDQLEREIAALRAQNAAEVAAHPAAPALAQIEARVAKHKKRRLQKRLGLATIAIGATAAILFAVHTPGATPRTVIGEEGIRVKGRAHLTAYKQVGEEAQRLEADAVVHAGDLVQLRYDGGGHAYGLIASVDGNGVVTLHYPLAEDAPPEATALAAKPTTLAHSYALDDAPRFERFFFITANDPIDVRQSLAALHVLAGRPDSADATLELPAGSHQWSLRLRKGPQ